MKRPVDQDLCHGLASQLLGFMSPVRAADGPPVQGGLNGSIVGLKQPGLMAGGDAIGHEACAPACWIRSDLKDRKPIIDAPFCQGSPEPPQHGVLGIEEERNVVVQVHRLAGHDPVGTACLTGGIREIGVGHGAGLDAATAEQTSLLDPGQVVEVGDVEESGDHWTAKGTLSSLPVLLFRVV